MSLCFLSRLCFRHKNRRKIPGFGLLQTSLSYCAVSVLSGLGDSSGLGSGETVMSGVGLIVGMGVTMGDCTGVGVGVGVAVQLQALRNAIKKTAKPIRAQDFFIVCLLFWSMIAFIIKARIASICTTQKAIHFSRETLNETAFSF